MKFTVPGEERLGPSPCCQEDMESSVDYDEVLDRIVVSRRCLACGTQFIDSVRPAVDEPSPVTKLRAIVQFVRRTKPSLCPSCRGRRHRNCHVPQCECWCEYAKKRRSAS